MQKLGRVDLRRCRLHAGSDIGSELESEMPKKKAAKEENVEAGKDEDELKKITRTATTIYVESDLFKKWKKRVIDEPEPGYVIIEEMIKGFLGMNQDVVTALRVKMKDSSDEKKAALYRAVEEAILRHLEKSK
jgi:hypothetical protein